jgi:microcystin-dependent protein
MAVPINRRFMRFIDGGGVTWTLTDNPGDDEIQVSAVAAGGGGGVPTGSVTDFAGTSAPSGWLECDGAAYGRTAMDPDPQPALFAAIGTTWGAGDGVTTFNVPNLNRRTTVGRGGTGTGVLGNAVGNTGGAETHTLVTGEMPSHSHSVTDPGHQHQQVTANGTGPSHPIAITDGVSTNNTPNASVLVGSNTTGISIQNAGSGGAHNNIQPSAVVMKIIKV